MANRYFADVSNNNSGHIDFNSYVHDGQHVLVGLKASEGMTFIDRTHATRSQDAHKAGCWVIHYHFAHPDVSAHAQAKFFWDLIKGHFAAKDFACIDIEVANGRSYHEISIFVREFASAFHTVSGGHNVIGYTGESFLSDIGRSGIRRWWTAAYGPKKPARCWAWQFTDGVIGPEPHTCKGIGHCDVSVLNWPTYLRLRMSKPRV